MEIATALIVRFNRDDLKEAALDKPFADININDIPYVVSGFFNEEDLKHSAAVITYEDEENIKTLKNRYSHLKVQ